MGKRKGPKNLKSKETAALKKQQKNEVPGKFARFVQLGKDNIRITDAIDEFGDESSHVNLHKKPKKYATNLRNEVLSLDSKSVPQLIESSSEEEENPNDQHTEEDDSDEQEQFEKESGSEEQENVDDGEMVVERFAEGSDDEDLDLDDINLDDISDEENANVDIEEFGDINKKEKDETWGTNKKDYYSNEFFDTESRLNNVTKARFEEEEALRLQKKKLENISDADFSEFAHILNKKPVVSSSLSQKDKDLLEATTEVLKFSSNIENLPKDHQNISDEQKLELVLSNAPELPKLLVSLKDNLEELSLRILPLFNSEKLYSENNQADYFMKLKIDLIVTYMMNLSFYLTYKAAGNLVKDHPVIKEILRLTTILNKMRDLDRRLLSQLSKNIEEISEEEQISMDTDNIEDKETTKATENENNKPKKRPATKIIKNNIGLRKYRKKDAKTSRTRNRDRYNKLLNRRKAQVGNPRDRGEKYKGESKGIKTNVIKSTQFK